MEDLSNIKRIRPLLAKHGFTFSKAMGQNFLINPAVCPRMAELALPEEGYGVLEIGAGIGVLTQELSVRAQKVLTLEIDGRLLPVLKETLQACDNVQVRHADVMKLDLAQLLREEFAGMRVVVAANLPYYITSPILMHLLESRLPVESITVMVQREAAQRLCAPPGTRACGAVSIAVRYYSEPEVLFEVERTSFLPAPDVDSCVIRLQVHHTPPINPRDEAFFFRVVHAAFCQRRKTLGNALASGLGIPKDVIGAAIPDYVGLRAEALRLEQFCAVADILAEIPAF